MKKLAAICLALILCVLMLAPAVGATSTVGTAAVVPNGYLSFVDFSTPRLIQGETWNGKSIKIQYTPNDLTAATTVQFKIVAAELVVDGDVNSYPFDIRNATYLQDNKSGDSSSMSYSFYDLRVRSDAEPQFYDIKILVYYSYFDTETKLDTAELSFQLLVSPSGATAAPDGKDVAKVMISAFSTNPTEVVAGEEFLLGVVFKNTSSHEITSFKAAMTSDTFHPVSGSSSIFIDAIPAGGTKSATMRLTSKSDVAPGSYNASFALNYNDPNNVDGTTQKIVPVTDTEVISIPVKQIPKIMTTKIQIQPTEVYVGQDINLMSTVNNTGKSKLYNVNVTVNDSGSLLSETQAYLGNIDSGATGNVDLYITPLAAGSSTATMLVTYEDENGKQYTAQETADFTVMDMGGDIGGDMPIEDFPVEPQQSGGGMWWLIIVAVAVVGAVVSIIMIRRSRKKARAQRDKLEAKKLEAEYLLAKDAADKGKEQ